MSCARLSLTGGLVGWCVLSFTWRHLSPGHPNLVTSLGYLLIAALLLMSGATQLVRLRITPDSRLSWTAVGLTLTGVAILLLGGQQLLTGMDGALRPLPLIRPLALAPALIALGIAALPHPPSIVRRTGTMIIAGTVAYATAGLALTAPSVRHAMHRADDSLAWPVIGALIVTAWVMLAIRVLLRPASPRRDGWLLALVLLAASSLSQTVGLRLRMPFPDQLSVGLLLAAAVVTLGTTTSELRTALALTSRRLLTFDADLSRARRLLAASEQRDAERRHDARSAALGIEAAIVEVHDPIRRTVSAELGRLVALLGDPQSEAVRPFALDEALAPVLDAQRRAGLVILIDDLSRCVVGRPTATAGALANVLANVMTHAPGAVVTVHTVADGDTVALVVDDDGPGIPEFERRRVLLRAERGAGVEAPGSGLGLFTASRSMAEQGGSLHIAERPGGGARVVLSLRAPAGARTLAEVG